MYALSELYPATSDPKDVLATYFKRRETYFFMDVMARGEYPNYTQEIFIRKNIMIKLEDGDLEIIKKYPLDYVTFSYYRSTIVDKDSSFDIMDISGGKPNPYVDRTEWGWAVDPIGLRYCLNEILIVTKNHCSLSRMVWDTMINLKQMDQFMTHIASSM